MPSQVVLVRPSAPGRFAVTERERLGGPIRQRLPERIPEPDGHAVAEPDGHACAHADRDAGTHRHTCRLGGADGRPAGLAATDRHLPAAR